MRNCFFLVQYRCIVGIIFVYSTSLKWEPVLSPVQVYIKSNMCTIVCSKNWFCVLYTILYTTSYPSTLALYTEQFFTVHKTGSHCTLVLNKKSVVIVHLYCTQNQFSLYTCTVNKTCSRCALVLHTRQILTVHLYCTQDWFSLYTFTQT